VGQKTISGCAQGSAAVPQASSRAKELQRARTSCLRRARAPEAACGDPPLSALDEWEYLWIDERCMRRAWVLAQTNWLSTEKVLSKWRRRAIPQLSAPNPSQSVC